MMWCERCVKEAIDAGEGDAKERYDEGSLRKDAREPRTEQMIMDKGRKIYNSSSSSIMSCEWCC
jgi:hypothetical protein